jgi:hypothetical protein
MHRHFLLGAGISLAACTSSNSPMDAGADSGLTPFSFKPTGCDYTIAPPDSRGYVDLAADKDVPGADALRVRIGLGGGTTKGQSGYADPTTTAVFTWETAAANGAAKVKIGSDVYKGYTWSTPPPEKGFGNTDPPGYMHEVHVCGLKAGTTYMYQVGGDPTWSASQSFTTVPGQGPITVGISGDARDNVDTWRLVQRRMKDAAVAMQIFSGDLVLYGASETRFGNWLDAIWKDPMTPGSFITLGQQMIVPVGGNHEGMSAQYYGNFALPGDGALAESYGSFDVGTVHLVFVDDQLVGGAQPDAQTQLDWLKADLDKASKDRAAHPFIVFYHHRSMFSTTQAPPGHSTDSDVVKTRQALVPIMEQYGVDLVFGGHDHDFERSKPLKGPADNPMVQADPKMGTTYVVSAGAGADPYPIGTAPAAYREKNVAFGGSTPYVGVYTLMKINGNALQITSYGLKASSTNVMGDDMIDDFTLMR